VLRVSVQAPPVEGAANRALVRLLARCFHIRPSSVRLLRGAKSKIKTVELADLTAEQVKRSLEDFLGQSHDGERQP